MVCRRGGSRLLVTHTGAMMNNYVMLAAIVGCPVGLYAAVIVRSMVGVFRGV